LIGLNIKLRAILGPYWRCNSRKISYGPKVSRIVVDELVLFW